MRILISCLSRSWGGMEMFAVQSAQSLLSSNENIKVFFLCLKNSRIEKALTFLEDKNILKLPDNLEFNPVNIFALSNFIKKNSIELIHTQYSKDLWTIVPSLKLLNSHIPLVFTKQLGSFVIKKDFLHRWIYNRVDKAIAISEIIKRNLIETTTLNHEKIIVIHNAIDLTRFSREYYDKQNLRKRLNLNQNDFIFTNVARLSPGKGQDLILKAINLIKNEIYNVKFLFVGVAQEDEKSYEMSLKEYVKKNSLQPFVEFLGFRNDIPEILAASDAFIFPSQAEAFGIALIEAMAMGLPNIVCKSDGILDIIIEEETSLIFERNDVDTLAKQIIRIIQGNELRKKLSENSILRSKVFSFQTYNFKILKVYTQLIEDKTNLN